MKKLVTSVILLLFLLGNNGTYGQFKPIKLILKSGDSLTGLGKFSRGKKVKFKKNKASKAVKYNFKNLKRVQIYDEDEIINYVYLKKKGKKIFRFYKELVRGEVSLYKIVVIGSAGGYGAVGHPGVPSGIRAGDSFSFVKYFIKRKEDNGVTRFWEESIFSKSFKKAALDYFYDCKIIVEKVKKKEYKVDNIVEMVEYYNTKCHINKNN